MLSRAKKTKLTMAEILQFLGTKPVCKDIDIEWPGS